MAEAQRRPIVYRLSDRLVVGEHPRGGVGNEHRIEVIAQEEYEKLLRTDPSYITEDGLIVSGPPA